MDVKYINPFIASVKTVFKTMVATEVTVGKPSIQGPEGGPGVVDVSAVIGLSGDAVGCVILSLPMATAVGAASKFAGIDIDENHADFADALGELANMIAGQAKANLQGLAVSISLPSVIIGREHVVSRSRQAPRLILPCESPLGTFYVEVAMIIEKKASCPAPAMAATH